MHIGKAIRLKRKELGLSQSDLARMCGVTTSAICHIEKGGRNPRKALLDKINDVLNSNPEDLADDTDIDFGTLDDLAVLHMLEKRVDATIADLEITKTIIKKMIKEKKNES